MKCFGVPLLLLTLTVPLAAQNPGIEVPQNLIVDGIPPLPEALVDATRRYTEFRSANFLSWSPTHLEMLISTRFGDVAQVHLVSFPGGARTQLTFFPDPVVSASFEPRNGSSFVFSKDVGGGERYQLYRYEMVTGESSLLTDGNSRNSPGIWSNTGERLAYGSTRRNGKDVDFYIVNPGRQSAPSMILQLDEGESWSILTWAPNDSTILAREQNSASNSSLWLIDVESHARRILCGGVGRQISYGAGQFSNDGKGIYTTSDRVGEFKQLVYIDIASGKETPLTGHIPWDVETFDVTREGKLIALVTNEDGIGTLRLLNTATGRDQPVTGLPIGVIGDMKWHADGTHLAFTFTSARTGSDVYVLNAQTGRIERWTTSESGGLPLKDCAEPQLIHWKTFDGRTLSGFLYNPSPAFNGKRPVMIVIHGGPEGQSRPTFLGRSNYFLNELGVALLYPNVRGSTGYGKNFMKLDDGMSRDNSYKDIASLLDWVKTENRLDGDRILITGGSYGGHMTLAAEAFYGDRIRCAVDVVGMSDLVTFLERTESYRRDLRRAEYGDERDSTMRAYLERIAPLNHVKDMTRPLFVVAGKNDPRVPLGESEQIVQALKLNRTPVWFLTANDEGHGFRKKKNLDYQFLATVQFMKMFLLN